ncbi:hypothetical protein FOA43_001296 [Brettanomyces nanus]|uniref:F-box domain-containing protein n=1 Tax=Eeniella nana TaxID=13502 RepID=A0A875RNP2_EENNA|nr:uncharacterized protein FOA43_001296 [Brettanomyces nanus]QPG73980.1 hypothetical protein FOA43_001296 [Brettanomyces nanus]
MTFPLLDLPDDIISFHLVDCLDSKDIINLFLTCKQLYQILNSPVVWHSLYIKTFSDLGTDDYSFDSFYRWGPRVYKLRANSRLLTFGSNVFARLGEQIGPVSSYSGHYERVGLQKRIFKPITIDSIRNIADISAGGFSFQILTTNGELYYTGHMWHGGMRLDCPGPESRDDAIPLSNVHNRGSSAISRVETDQSNQGQTHFISVSSGRGHFIALDKSGIIWTWDSSFQSNQGVPLRLIRNGSVGANAVINRRITKIRAGWTLSSCLIDGVGIVIWSRRQNCTQWKNGRPVNSDGEYPAAFVSIVPKTADGNIADYVVLQDVLIYMTQKGRLFKVDNITETLPGHTNPGTRLNRFESYIKAHGSSKFVRLSGSFRTFTVISNNDNVLIGKSSCDHYNTPQIVHELQHKSISTISAGDYHFLALSRAGKLYTWGRESRFNGCLGLGKVSDIVNARIGHIDQQDLIVDKPTLNNIDGTVLAVAAAGWQSAILVGKDY